MDRIYLDHAATTPVLPEVEEAMRPWLAERYGNPSSLYAEGREARNAIDAARARLAEALGCEFAEVCFTSSGTEAANLALLGVALGNKDLRKKRILMSAVEHPCVRETRPLLERLGYFVETLPVDRYARVDLDAFRDSLGDDVLLVSVMQANNELGTIQPVEDVIEAARKIGAFVHCDAVQGFLTLPPPKADLVSASSHKVHGPKGVGALVVRGGTPFSPVSVGGGQERERRAGTENVAGIVGFATAASLVPSMPDGRREAAETFLSVLPKAGFVSSVPDEVPTVPGFAHVRLPGVDAETMLIRLDRAGISASSGAACSSGSLEASHVLLACGYTVQEAKEGLRFTFGRSAMAGRAKVAASRITKLL